MQRSLGAATTLLAVAALSVFPCSAQSEKSTCVILKRMGPADEVTSHLYSFGIRGKQFQYVEGDFPAGLKFHGRLTDNDVRQIMDKGGKIQVLDPKYSPSDLDSARKGCSGSPTSVTNDASEPTPGESADTSASVAPTSVTPATASTGTVKLISTPVGADVYVDGRFVGNAPAELQLSPGSHTVGAKMRGYGDWTREIAVSAGTVNLNADLVSVAVKKTEPAGTSTSVESETAQGSASSLPTAPSRPTEYPTRVEIKPALENRDIVAMVHAKVGDAVVLEKIKTNQTNFDVSVAAIVALKKSGVSDAVIRAMISAEPNSK
jgi:hypothetical protein